MATRLGSVLQKRTSGTGGVSNSYAGLTSEKILEKYEKSYAEAKAANEERYQQGLGILDQAISRYQPGGSFGQGAMAQYETGKKQAMASGMQSLVSSGLANTTIAGTLPLAYEQEVGTPFRLQLEDLRMQNLTEAEQAKTGFIEARQDPYPDFGMFAQLAMQSAMQQGTGQGTGSNLLDLNLESLSGFSGFDSPGTFSSQSGVGDRNIGGVNVSGGTSGGSSLGGGYTPGGSSSGNSSSGGLTQGSISPYSTLTGTSGNLQPATKLGGGEFTQVGSGLGAGFGLGQSETTTSGGGDPLEAAIPDLIFGKSGGDASQIIITTGLGTNYNKLFWYDNSTGKYLGSATKADQQRLGQAKAQQKATSATDETNQSAPTTSTDRSSAYNQVLTPYGY